ncbi:MAG: efflux RND transporter permease subunit [Lysobacterales bacterium]
MSLIRWSTDNPAALTAAAVLALVFGVLAVGSLPIQMLPNLEYPQININTGWRSAAPQEVEASIIQPQENALRNVPGVVAMTSNVRSGGGNIQLQFDLNTNLQQAMVDVLSALNNAQQPPPDAQEPSIHVGGWGNPLATLLVHPLDPAPGVDVTRFQDVMDNEVAPALRNIPGVARVDLNSEREPMLLVNFDPYLTASLGLSVSEIARTLTRAVNSTGGLASVGRRQYTVRFLGGLDLEQWGELVVARRGERPVFLRDIAEVTQVLYPRSGFMYRTGFPAYYVRVQGRYGANTVSVLDDINAAITELNAGPLAQRDLKMVLSFDSSVHIRRALALVNTNLLLGVLLALGVLWLFLRRLGATALIALTIPFSLAAAFVALNLLGRSINVISLAGLAFAVGLVLDAAIVVQENIVRLRQGGMSLARATQEGPAQVVGALVTSTVTSIAIFLPIVFMQGIEGQLFTDLAITLSVAVAASAVAALTLLPAASARLLNQNVDVDPLAKTWRRLSQGVMALTDSSGRRAIWIVALIAVPVLSTWATLPKLDFLPQADGDGVEVSFSMPEGVGLTTIENELIGEVIARLKPHVDGDVNPGIRGYNLYSYGTDSTGIYIYPSDPREASELMTLLKEELLSGLPGVSTFVSRASLLNVGISGGRNINLDLQGPDLEPLMSAAAVGLETIERDLPGWSVRAMPGITMAKPELQLSPDDLRISQAGLDRQDVGDAIRAVTGGLYTGRYFNGQEGLDVILWGGGWDTPEDLAALPLPTPAAGVQVMGELAPLQRRVGPTQLRRVNGQRTITLQVLPPQDVTLEEALAVLKSQVEPTIQHALPAGSEMFYRGTADDLGNAVTAMAQNFLIAVLILALIMAALFRSLMDSVIVLLIMPLAVAGGVVALHILNLFTYQALELLTMVGLIMVLGLVVNNAILLVHQTRAAQRNGQGLRDAVAQAVNIRARPIFMSTLTSIFGMLPLMLVPGAGSEIYRGLATVIVGGMCVSSVFTLILLPAILRLPEGRQVRLSRQLGDDEERRVPRQPTVLVPQALRKL